ncbi:MAG: hypothetical protein L0271_16840 [Gemmatimonadetes bacterium]|nr:hypothetical protein [Gemmatimonadota bacterium]
MPAAARIACPGILVSTSPVRFDAEVGFAADDLFTGTVTVSGTIDGGTIAETRALPLLVVLAVVLLAIAGFAFRKRRTQRAES